MALSQTHAHSHTYHDRFPIHMRRARTHTNAHPSTVYVIRTLVWVCGLCYCCRCEARFCACVLLCCWCHVTQSVSLYRVQFCVAQVTRQQRNEEHTTTNSQKSLSHRADIALFRRDSLMSLFRRHTSEQNIIQSYRAMWTQNKLLSNCCGAAAAAAAGLTI